MKTPAQVLELALSQDKDHPLFDVYMCWHLMHMYGAKLITFEEYTETKQVVMASLDGYIALSTFLRAEGVMPSHFSMYSHEYLPVREKFYRDLIAKLRAADPMFLIIEAAYHCAHSYEEVHAAVKAAGLPETSDETIANLLGEYADSLKD